MNNPTKELPMSMTLPQMVENGHAAINQLRATAQDLLAADRADRKAFNRASGPASVRNLVREAKDVCQLLESMNRL